MIHHTLPQAMAAEPFSDAWLQSRVYEGRQLNIYHTSIYLTPIDTAAATKISTFLANNPHITSLHLQHITFEDSSWATLLSTLPDTSVTYLNNNGITSVGIGHLARVLHKFERLDLRLNPIDDECARLLGAALQEGEGLKELWLSGSRIARAGANALMEGLRFNSSVRRLSMGGSTLAWGAQCDISILLKAPRVADVLVALRSVLDLVGGSNRHLDDLGFVVVPFLGELRGRRKI